MPAVPKRGRVKHGPTATLEDLETEGSFKAPLVAAINALPGFRAWYQQAGRLKVRGGFIHLAPKGAGDVVGRAPPDGLFFEVETKGRTTAVQPSQDPWAAETIAAGGVYVRCRPRRGESLGEAVARCVAELLEAIGEARSRRAGGGGAWAR